MQRELKVFNWGNTAGIGDFAISVCQPITKGVGGGQRIGDHILVKRVQIRTAITWGANAENAYSSTIRDIFLCDHRGLFSDVTFFDNLFDSSVSTFCPMEVYNPSNVNRFDILHDSFRVLKQEAQSSVYEPVWRYVPIVSPYDRCQVLTFDDLNIVVSFPTVGSALNNLVFLNTFYDPLTQLSGTYFTFSIWFEDFN